MAKSQGAGSHRQGEARRIPTDKPTAETIRRLGRCREVITEAVHGEGVQPTCLIEHLEGELKYDASEMEEVKEPCGKQGFCWICHSRKDFDIRSLPSALTTPNSNHASCGQAYQRAPVSGTRRCLPRSTSEMVTSQWTPPSIIDASGRSFAATETPTHLITF